MIDSAWNMTPLAPMFRPQSVTTIGASSDPSRIGGRAVSLLKSSGFSGSIYPVNPNCEHIQGLRTFGTLDDVANDVDRAIRAVPAAQMDAPVRACAAKGVRDVTLFSVGYAETGPEGRQVQDRLGAITRKAGMRMLGPNGMGVTNFADGMVASFHAAFAGPVGRDGRIGLVSQSGAIGGLSCMMAHDRGIPFRHVLTSGNEADVEASDRIAYLADDPGTEVILLCLEGCRNVPRLVSALDLAARNRKQVVALKLGRTDAGAAAAASHTAALAGSDVIYDPLFCQFGVYRANTLEEFIDVGCAAALRPVPANRKVGVITVSGGIGTLIADDAQERRLDVAPFLAATQAGIRAMVPFAGLT